MDGVADVEEQGPECRRGAGQEAEVHKPARPGTPYGSRSRPSTGRPPGHARLPGSRYPWTSPRNWCSSRSEVSGLPGRASLTARFCIVFRRQPVHRRGNLRPYLLDRRRLTAHAVVRGHRNPLTPPPILDDHRPVSENAIGPDMHCNQAGAGRASALIPAAIHAHSAVSAHLLIKILPSA
jgi:hypothetical protein